MVFGTASALRVGQAGFDTLRLLQAQRALTVRHKVTSAMSPHDHDNVTGNCQPERDYHPGDSGRSVSDISLPSARALGHAVRLTLITVGAFLFGVLPGGILVDRIARTSGVHLRIGEIVALQVLFASVGACSGVALYRLFSWSSPTATDVCVAIGSGLLFGFCGFALLVYLTPGT